MTESLAMPLLVALTGEFPTRGDGGTNAYFTLGMVQTFAGFSAPFGAPRAAGQACRSTIRRATRLCSRCSEPVPAAMRIGASDGGDGETTFALPDLRGLMVTGLAG